MKTGRTTVKLSDNDKLSVEVGDSGRDAGNGMCEGEIGRDRAMLGGAMSSGVDGRGVEAACDGDSKDKDEDNSNDNNVTGGGLFPRLQVVKGMGMEGTQWDGSLAPLAGINMHYGMLKKSGTHHCGLHNNDRTWTGMWGLDNQVYMPNTRCSTEQVRGKREKEEMTCTYMQHQYIYPQGPNSTTQQEGSTCPDKGAIKGIGDVTM
ncbi:hypothetical protein F5J12DRAFT_947559 [Pisolithus orientalis]|uniref:uncharacterized protein n=1 Tax=Pisolithus orientalis TaxID=936130 RepID=UPI002224B0A5|nr:uncharacterized protein F5J12DRAFT_947559 [Pisolithus orientalis]KAI6002675.1 hypothetical protein F5J12DRAFT_947559 [Pisolithus orientalis]